MKKKILFVNRNFIIGGIEKSLFNIATAVKDDFEIDIKVLKNVGELKNDFAKNFNISEIDKKTRKWGFYYKYKKGHFFYNLYYFFVRAIRRLIIRNVFLLKKIVKKFTSQNNYDIAICYTQDPICREYILEKVEAKKKFIFLHYDICSVNKKELAIDRLKMFDKVFCVSKSCADYLISISNKELQNVEYIYNFCPNANITQTRLIEDNRLKIISASRLTQEKGIERFLQVLSKLRDESFKFCYYIIGDGVNKKNIIKTINKYKLKDNVFLLGYKKNPKDYIKDCDLFVLPSYQESFGMVLIEAMQVGVPCFTTKTISAKEVIGDKGFVCENSSEGIYKSLKEILLNKDLIEEKKEFLKGYKFDNNAIKEKFLNYLNENLV